MIFKPGNYTLEKIEAAQKEGKKFYKLNTGDNKENGLIFGFSEKEVIERGLWYYGLTFFGKDNVPEAWTVQEISGLF